MYGYACVYVSLSYRCMGSALFRVEGGVQGMCVYVCGGFLLSRGQQKQTSSGLPLDFFSFDLCQN